MLNPSEHLFEQQYLAGEREAEIKALLNDPEMYLVPCDCHNSVLPNCSGCQYNNLAKGATA